MEIICLFSMLLSTCPSSKLSVALVFVIITFVLDKTTARPCSRNDHELGKSPRKVFEGSATTSSREPEGLMDGGTIVGRIVETEHPGDERPWQINQGLCPPPLAHLCTVEVPGPSGGSQQAFVTPFFEGDIVLDPGTRRSLGVASMMHRAKLHGRHAVKNAQRSRRVRAAVRPENQRWTDGVIPYTIDSDFAPSTARLIRAAMKHWERHTCIHFRHHRPKDRDYIRFAYFPGCWSFVGRQGGQQIISMGPGCSVLGTIIHEIGHAVGFWHEQSRHDRDKYVKIMYHNIVPGTEENFGIIDPVNVTSLGFSYDYESIMHYPPNAFTATGLPTIKIKKIGRRHGFKMGQQEGLSALDIAQVNAMYQCNLRKMAKESDEECTPSKRGDGREYRGNRDFTVSGTTCQKWNSQWPHKQEYWKSEAERNERQGLGDHNYCRNPSGKRDRPWCFTTLKKTRWEYCDVKICAQET
ncbi:zinc metalloproteinase nas-6-like [Asterias rubens]|uniref:zinc metalloproteinase nas-6-like n=1 Tax=Asterias rubens TaxID=7604 RepID=UPI0014555090|nr:zinc metalloproteinase nas-6-like [Asterias rubens]